MKATTQGGGNDAGHPRRSAQWLFLTQQFAANLGVAFVLTIVATILVYHGRPLVPLWGMGNLASDLIPSTLLPTIGASLAISRAVRSAVGQGLIKPAAPGIYRLLPGQDALAGVAIGLILLVALGTAFIGAVSFVYGRQPIPYGDVTTCKLLYALILCLANTPIIVSRAKERAFPDPDPMT
jgi:hypothetical protein